MPVHPWFSGRGGQGRRMLSKRQNVSVLGQLFSSFGFVFFLLISHMPEMPHMDTDTYHEVAHTWLPHQLMGTTDTHLDIVGQTVPTETVTVA